MGVQFEEITPQELTDFTARSEWNNIYQTPAWAQVKKEWQARFVGMRVDGVLKATAMILFRPLPMGMKLAYIPRGPIIDYHDQQTLQEFIRRLRRYCRSQNAIECKFDPYLIIGQFAIDDKEAAWNVRSPYADAITACGARFCGYTKLLTETVQPRFQLCFEKSENWEDRLPKKTREKIRTSETKGIRIEIWGIEYVHELAEMIEFTERRKNIHLRNEDYFRTIMEAFEGKTCILAAHLNQEEARRRVIEKQDSLRRHLQELDEKANKKKSQLEKQIADLDQEKEKLQKQAAEDGTDVLVSALLLVHDGRTAELLYSGLNEKYRRYLAAYSLRHAAIQWAFDQGCTRFNFGGVEGTLNDGLYTFKSSFNPQIDVYLGEFSLSCSKLLYPLWNQLLPRYKELRRQWLRRESK